IYLGQLDGSAVRRLFDAEPGAVFLNGHVLFIRQSKVFAQPFDVNRLELSGNPLAVDDNVYSRLGYFNSILPAGRPTPALRLGSAHFAREFRWVDRSGGSPPAVGDALVNPDGVSYSPDRSQLVFFERREASSDLWILDTRRGVVSRFTDEPDEDIFPVWSRDGGRIIYTIVRNGEISLCEK